MIIVGQFPNNKFVNVAGPYDQAGPYKSTHSDNELTCKTKIFELSPVLNSVTTMCKYCPKYITVQPWYDMEIISYIVTNK